MEQLLLTHATAGDRERIDYSAAFVVPRPSSIVPRLEDQGVQCHDLRGADPRDLRWVGRLVALVRREDVDVVHFHSPLVAALARPALRAMPRRPRLVYTEHNSSDFYAPPTRWANMATYPLDDARFAVSAAARSSTPTRLQRHTEVLVHGVDVAAIAARRQDRAKARAALGIDETEQLVGIVANLRAAKAYSTLLRAAVDVVAARADVRFVSLGHGPLERELLGLRDELGLRDRFDFLGHVPEATTVMAGFDVLTLSSDVEGLPVSVMEAKALALPVVATAVGGLPEMVTTEVDGLLVPPRDPRQLAGALLRVLDDDDLRARLAAASASGATRFDARSAVRRQDDLYLELAAARR